MNILLPPKFKKFYKKIKDKKVNILDVGSGNHSPSLTKKWFPNSIYHAIDMEMNFNNDDSDLKCMNRFFEMDLTSLQFNDIPDNFYDVVILAHVIEHLKNGDKVIAGLLPKIKNDGIIYIEFPSERSTKLPSKKGTLNFYDDPTHCRVYKIRELRELLEKNNFEVLNSGIRRDWVRIILLPLNIIKSKIDFGYVAGSVFWDLLGFADYVYARKK